MIPAKRNVVFSLLWPNVFVLVVVLTVAAANHVSSVRQLLRILGYAMIYANVTLALAAILLLLAMKSRCKPTSQRLLLIVSVLVITPLGCLLAQALLSVTGLVVPARFWLEYLHTMRVVMPLAMVFGLGAFVYGSLHGRVEQMEIKLREKEIAEERARKLATEARLRSLEAQIHPHFLFNTLNSISSLIAVNPARAEQIVGRLAVLLRASLDTSGQPLIPLRQELAMVESYLDIERARFGDKLRSSIAVPNDLGSVKVPPMSVQSLVENAVKYGITPHNDGGEVVVTGVAENGNLRIEIRDTGPGFDLSAVPAGHGLDNLVSRLNALFGVKARLNVLRRDGYSVVEMVLPRI